MSAGLAAWLRGVEPAGAPELEAALGVLLGADACFEGTAPGDFSPGHLSRPRLPAP